MNKLFLVSIFSLLTSLLNAQSKYWITFKDKNILDYHYENYLSKETIKNRKRFDLPVYQYTDVPVNKTYIDSLKKMDINVLVPSRWLNSVSAYLNAEQVKKVMALSFVMEVSLIDRRLQIAGNNYNLSPQLYAPAAMQMEGNEFTMRGITGKGINIGLIDAGFYSAFKDPYLNHIFEENRLKQQRDFLTPPINDLVRDTIQFSDNHGRVVLEHIAGYDTASHFLIGLAPNSNFYLARTENEAREYRGEEDNWIQAMEWMDSVGVRLINTSLGYSIHMDDPKEDYKQEEMNGSTARISKAAQIATDEKGIFVVVSAGNEGDNPKWRIISAPADAPGVLSVGATWDESWEKIGYSSIGPEFLSYLKPNVSCYSLNGTSFSAPSVAGFVACLMEMDSTLSNKQLKEIVEKSGHLYPYGNNYIGYGVPLASRAIKLIQKENEFQYTSELKSQNKKITIRPEIAGEKKVVLFHKKSKTCVLKQEIVSIKNGKFTIKRLPDEKYTTVVIDNKVTEIVWHE